MTMLRYFDIMYGLLLEKFTSTTCPVLQMTDIVKNHYSCYNPFAIKHST